MDREARCSLWTTSKRSRYFLVPTNQQLPNGDFAIRSLTGKTHNVDLSAIAPFEITAQAAKPYLQTALNQAWQQTKDSLSIFANFAASAQDKSTLESPANHSIAALLGLTDEDLQSNPDALKQQLREVLNGLQDVLKGAISDDPTHLETAQARIHTLRQHLGQQGIEVKEDIELLPTKLRQQYLGTEINPGLQESAQKLQAATTEIKRSFNALLQTLKEGAAKVQAGIDEAECSKKTEQD